MGEEDEKDIMNKGTEESGAGQEESVNVIAEETALEENVCEDGFQEVSVDGSEGVCTETTDTNREGTIFTKGILMGMLGVMIPLLILLCGLTVYLKTHNCYITIASGKSAELNGKLSLIRKMIDKYYLFDYDEEDLDDAALSDYVDSLGDPYTVYYNEDEFKDLEESNNGSYKGIGVSLHEDSETGKIYIDEVFKDSPAEAAGLKSQDQLVRIGEEEVTGMDLDKAVDMIKNSEEDSVNLTVNRDGKEISADVEIKEIEVETVTSKMLEKGIGYIQLTQFEDVSTEQFQDAVDELKDKGMKKLIVDLRGNPGGLLSVAVDIADVFVDTGVVVYTKDKNDKEETYKADEKGALDMPVVVLVDGDSASASEVLCGCLKDYDLATLVGTKTFGKGIVQKVIPFNDGTGIKVTIAHYYTPDGNDIHGVGITPDVVVEDDPDTTEDEQLDQALKVIKEMK